MYIGNIELSAVESFGVDDSTKPNGAVGGLGTSGYEMAEYASKLPDAELTGYLLQKYGDSRTLNQLVEDAQAIRQRPGSFNFINSVNEKSGWFFCSGADIPYSSGALRDMVLKGLWMDAAAYTTKLHCRPVTMANDWAISGQNWIAVPIGSSWSGGSTTETLSSEDGDITRVQTDSILFDLAAVESGKGEVRCYDGSTQIYNHEHIFSGDCVISNGLYKVTLSSNTITVYYWSGSVYTKIDDFTAGTFSRVTLTGLTQDKVICKTSNAIEITVERGRVPMINSSVDLTCGSLTPADQSTSTDNYLTLGTDLYVCSNRGFSIVSNVIGAGNVWIFHEDTVPQTIAHNAIVISNLKREVVDR
ncbi:hypothetical protein [Methanococcoides sp. AM1]|uniref:hypothetical protein n=1 Tax=Methanococcoides sp. AM1 TaxID=1201011 RepID=UPI001082458E|nr:hypothetical protein [Methanococcoides sp. AM1]